MTVIDKNKNITLTCSTDKLSTFLKKIRDLVAIDPRIIIRIEKESILIFSFVGNSFKDIHAFKNYIFPTSEIFSIKKGDINEPVFFLAKDGKRFYRNLENFLDYENDISMKFSVNEDNYVNFISLSNTKLDIKIIGNDSIIIGSQISIDDVNYLMDIDKSMFNFRINRSDFLRIKKMGLIENEPKSVLYLNIQNKVLSIGETKWHLNITDVDSEDSMMSFPKSYFNTINPSDYIDVYVFEEFIVCKYDEFNLMILLETTI